jgi:predicted nucleic acid-binding protein
VKIFWDTNLFIYLWERQGYSSEIDALCDWIESEEHTIVTSSLTLGEILVQPLRLDREETANHYRKGFSGLEIVSFDSKAANEFARLRALQTDLRPPDAIQLACALTSRCEVFLTADDRLSKCEMVAGLKALPLSRWKEAV